VAAVRWNELFGVTRRERHKMSAVIELTEEEQALIMKRREEIAAKEERRRVKLLTIEIAAKYEAWLQREGRGSTFSTFVNEFDYDEHDASLMFKRVEAIRAAAEP
jgi:hypothetical protein